MNSREDKGNPLLQALLQEYGNASQLYTNTIAVTYTRFFGFLAVHGALIVCFFLLSGQWRFLISIIGEILAILTFLSIEHVWQFTLFRIAQAREIEKQINEELSNAGIKIELTTFYRQATLFGNEKRIKKGEVEFPHLLKEKSKKESLPKSGRAAWLINIFPFQADRVTTVSLMILWGVLIFFSRVWN